MQWTREEKILIQGLPENNFSRYLAKMQEYQMNIVACVTSENQSKAIENIPYFNLVEEVIEAVGKIDISIIIVHPYHVLDAALEAMAAQIPKIVIVSRGVPPLDMIRICRKAKQTNTCILGSASDGIIMPEHFYLGIMDSESYTLGNVGILTTSSVISQELALEFQRVKLGVSTMVHLGNSKILGSSFSAWLAMLEEDEQTAMIVLIDKLGVNLTENLLQYIQSNIQKNIIFYLPGLQTPLPCFGKDAYSNLISILAHSLPSKRKRKNAETWQKSLANLAKNPLEVVAICQKYQNS